MAPTRKQVKTRHGWIRRHTFTMFQGHGRSLPEGSAERLIRGMVRE